MYPTNELRFIERTFLGKDGKTIKKFLQQKWRQPADQYYYNKYSLSREEWRDVPYEPEKPIKEKLSQDIIDVARQDERKKVCEEMINIFQPIAETGLSYSVKDLINWIKTFRDQ